MPLFEFKCNKCGTQYEKLIASTERSLPECPKCNETDVRKLISMGSIRANGISKGTDVSSSTCSYSGG
ncbi:zinc ribbon domain-containing protein [bacterium]|nr:zinc ribbon domain-containing protein [bacterium]